MNNNVLEFFVKMKDMMSGGLVKVAQNAQQAFAKVSQSVKQVDVTNKTVWGRAADHVRNYIRTLRGADSEARRITSGGNAFGLGAMLKRFVAPVAIGAALASMVTNTVTGGMRAEQDKVGLKTFLGAAGAEQAYANIRKDAAATPFDTQSLLMVNRSLISAGVSAQAARTDTLNLANAIAAVGAGNDELGRMAANMQQIKTVGKATAMDVRQFAMTGINIYQMLANATGKSVDQVKEMDVSYELLSGALAKAAAAGGMYEGALDAMSKTSMGRWGTFKDDIANIFTDLGTRLLPVINVALDVGSRLLQGISGWINGIGTGTGEWAGYIETAKGVWMTIWNVVKAVLGGVWQIASGITNWLMKSELVKDIFWAIGKIIQGVGAVVMWVVDKIVWLWDNVVKPILNAIEAVYSAIKYPLGKGAIKMQVEAAGGTSVSPTIAAPATLLSGRAPGAPGGSGGSSGAAAAVTSGGPRTININGVKFTDKIEIHSATIEEGLSDLENRLMNMFGRILNSGAAVQ